MCTQDNRARGLHTRILREQQGVSVPSPSKVTLHTVKDPSQGHSSAKSHFLNTAAIGHPTWDTLQFLDTQDGACPISPSSCSCWQPCHPQARCRAPTISFSRATGLYPAAHKPRRTHPRANPAPCYVLSPPQGGAGTIRPTLQSGRLP